MAILLNIDTARLQRQFGDPVVDAVAEAKVEQLERASRISNFRDDTGALRDTIRQERDGIVAIGDRRRDYWQTIYRFPQGRWAQVVARGVAARQPAGITAGKRRREVEECLLQCYTCYPSPIY